jgi:hypothetical protein
MTHKEMTLARAQVTLARQDKWENTHLSKPNHVQELGMSSIKAIRKMMPIASTLLIRLTYYVLAVQLIRAVHHPTRQPSNNKQLFPFFLSFNFIHLGQKHFNKSMYPNMATIEKYSLKPQGKEWEV